MVTIAPRAVVVTRETDYEALIARHATRAQARFFLESRDQDIDTVEGRHDRFHAALHLVRAAIPVDWRVASVRRDQLDRFLFAPEDIVIAVGQDGLVANLAKYLDGQQVLGINSEPDINPGVLVPFEPAAAAEMLAIAHRGDAVVERRTMARATLESGQTLLALNEIFIGHRSHQSARYRLVHGARSEDQSSSGVIVATGTGHTGWASSIARASKLTSTLAPCEIALAFFVREPWASPATGTELSHGRLEVDDALEIVSRQQTGGVVFADGIENDHLVFDWGARVRVQVARTQLNLITG